MNIPLDERNGMSQKSQGRSGSGLKFILSQRYLFAETCAQTYYVTVSVEFYAVHRPLFSVIRPVQFVRSANREPFAKNRKAVCRKWNLIKSRSNNARKENPGTIEFYFYVLSYSVFLSIFLIYLSAMQQYV